jgi:antitoxin component YwqK of YwqJK toxin-antitoxin module
MTVDPIRAATLRRIWGVSDNFTGTQKIMIKSGHAIYEADFVDGLLHGETREYYHDGLISLQRYEQGVRQGFSYSYYPVSGALWKKTYYEDDEYICSQYYFENGAKNGAIYYNPALNNIFPNKTE